MEQRLCSGLTAHIRKLHRSGLQKTRVYFSAKYKVQRRQSRHSITSGQGLREPDSICLLHPGAGLLKVTFQGQGASETSRWSEQETG